MLILWLIDTLSNSLALHCAPSSNVLLNQVSKTTNVQDYKDNIVCVGYILFTAFINIIYSLTDYIAKVHITSGGKESL